MTVPAPLAGHLEGTAVKGALRLGELAPRTGVSFSAKD